MRRRKYKFPTLHRILEKNEISSQEFARKSSVAIRTVERLVQGGSVSRVTATKIARCLTTIANDGADYHSYLKAVHPNLKAGKMIDPPEPWANRTRTKKRFR